MADSFSIILDLINFKYADTSRTADPFPMILGLNECYKPVEPI
ncbi:4790_t:CDS:2 [Ambispora leptoticha]|uniref:4790_t:CDS:1 n=1 Tax=Ambispora leptoticha TaxID=144679 RepID=A0A9N8VQC4_9GLOM|nr:4790_t:CDS:2 [Ambispora leptoticha]